MTSIVSTQILCRAGRGAARRFHLPVLGFCLAKPGLFHSSPISEARVRQGLLYLVDLH